MSQPTVTRPSLKAALSAWQECLVKSGLPAESVWIFAENLILEPRATPEGFRTAYQTKFTPPDDDALEIAYDIFTETDAHIVFYRLGTANKKSVCILLCDPWLDKRGEKDGFVVRHDWKVSFRPGPAGNIEEVTDLTRWVRRIKRGRDFQDFDFGMALATIDEIKLHGRPLMPYERMAEKMIGNLRRKLGQPE
ncbi:MAG TPA: hypothetical protein VG347_03195 [Verrucomicrobiae bacterium]|nr:hypothetical protein [Verrucomicrobiae bacterium]